MAETQAFIEHREPPARKLNGSAIGATDPLAIAQWAASKSGFILKHLARLHQLPFAQGALQVAGKHDL